MSIAKEIYRDVFSQAAKQAGVTLEEVAKLIFTPIYYPTKNINERIKRWFEKMDKEVSPSNRILAETNISIPALQGLALNQDDTILGEMFYNILKSSIDREKRKFMSPAFPEILRQLNRDECVFLVLLSKREYKIDFESDFDDAQRKFFNRHEILNELQPEKFFNFPENMMLYSNHLYSLGLSGCWKEESEPIWSDEKKVEQNGAFTITSPIQTGLVEHNIFRLTDFGKMFCEICITERCENYILAEDKE